MSYFMNVKCMKCYHCCRSVPIQEENFPEDLYDLIRTYDIKQLLWICQYCKDGTDLTSSVSQLCIDQKRIDQKLSDLTECFRSFTDEVRSQSQSFSESNLSGMSFHDVGDSSNSCGSDNKDLFSNDRIDVRNTFLSLSTCSIDSKKLFNNSVCKDAVESNTGFDTNSVKMGKATSSSPKESSEPLAIIHAILNGIKITKEEEFICKLITDSVLEKLLESLNRDPDFSCLYQKLYYTGSAYNDLRIRSATEFDINLVLQMPTPVTLTPEFFDKTHSFGKIKVEEFPNLQRPVEKFIESCTSDGYLVPQNVLSWLQRHVDNVLRKKFDNPDNVLDVDSNQNGPAKTLRISTSQGYSINVDLVPVFEFDSSVLVGTPFLAALQKVSKDTTNQTWFMVPKKCIGEIDLTLTDAKHSWRFDFPEAEKVVLHDKQCAKPIIKILKLLRDKQNWKDLASYYLKTVVLLEILENSSKQFWEDSKLFERFLQVLRKLKSHLDDQNLPHLIAGNNLFHKMSKIQCTNWSNYLQKVISAAESNKIKLSKFFL